MEVPTLYMPSRENFNTQQSTTKPFMIFEDVFTEKTKITKIQKNKN